ncbi:sterol O-acyltransferase 2 isoform X2 [Mixophyes fleayi]|uniref:sterol O-acyltransferase 2 isoform X2 n=1 Tax=Mixophyes fleayi TaxID=3061075 RepID=UPI003F4DE21E
MYQHQLGRSHRLGFNLTLINRHPPPPRVERLSEYFHSSGASVPIPTPLLSQPHAQILPDACQDRDAPLLPVVHDISNVLSLPGSQDNSNAEAGPGPSREQTEGNSQGPVAAAAPATQESIADGQPGQADGVSNHIKDLIEWKRHMEGVTAELVEDMSDHLRILLDKAVTEAVQSYRKEDKTVTSGEDERHHGPVSERKKVFLHRASLLDELMEVEHFRTIYHMFVAALCVFFISTVAVDIIDQGRLVLEFDLLFYTFGQLDIVAWSWICLFIYTLLVPFKVLTFWGSLYPKSNHKILLSAFMGAFLLIRLLMKSYSFLRETVPSILQQESKEKKEVQLPKLSSYLYFLFSPTLLYRDNYPRTPYIRWKFVAKNLAQFLGCLFFGYFILVNMCIPVFKNMSKQPFNTKTMVLSIFNSTVPGIFVLLLTFFAFLHCWLNAFAEMLRFADRMFYKDWWNSTSFSNYYRTWNLVVHDWLYHYVYQDLLWLFNQRFRAGVMLAVFLISASVHEYVFTLSLGYFYPVMFSLFAFFGVIFNFTMSDKWTSPIWNVMVWIFLFIGQGIQLCLYCQEWYAQIHCPITEKTFLGLITPRSWSCNW